MDSITLEYSKGKRATTVHRPLAVYKWVRSYDQQATFSGAVAGEQASSFTINILLTSNPLFSSYFHFCVLCEFSG